MKKIFLIIIAFILLVNALPVFPQGHQFNNSVCGRRICYGIPGEYSYGFKLSEPTIVDTNDVEHPFPARGGEVDWGLALSGGGIRSSAFSIGVMKALFDKGILDKIDVISSVSGGGYASYWLFTNYNQHKTQKFGEAALADNVFVKNMCELQGQANFFTNESAIRTFFRRGTTPFRKYENAILRSFGNGEPFDTKLNYLNPYIKNGDAPYFIINTTLVSDEMGGLGKLFEITPTHMGNPVIGFYRWERNGKESLRLSESITMSAAAMGKLKRPIPNFATHVIKAKNLQLWDGGKTENLGALPLIRRGIKYIVIADAEHDFDYKFEAYRKLKELLGAMGIEFYVPDIEEFLKYRKKGSVYSKSAVSMGYARSWRPSDGGNSIDSCIFYVKMSRPQTILPNDNAAECQGNPASNRPNDNDILAECQKTPADNDVPKTPFYKGECLRVDRNEKAESICPDGNLNCDGVAGFLFEKDMYLHIVQRYSYFLNCTRTKLRYLPRLFSSDLDFRYNFPQTTTWDQDYYRDQLEAFVGLGYMQASELNETVSVKEMQYPKIHN